MEMFTISKYHGTNRTLGAAKTEKKELVELIDIGKALKIRNKDTAMMTFGPGNFHHHVERKGA